MNESIQSYVRHLLTFLAGVGGLLLTWNVIDAESAAAINEAGANLIGPLAIFISAVCVGVLRMAMFRLGKKFPMLSGKVEDGKASGSSGGMLPLALCLLCASVLLPSCTAVSAAITGLPIPSTAVQRAGQPQAPVIHIASADLATAEVATEEAIISGAPVPVHGLYDAGQLAAKAREAVIEATK